MKIEILNNPAQEPEIEEVAQEELQEEQEVAEEEVSQDTETQEPAEEKVTVTIGNEALEEEDENDSTVIRELRKAHKEEKRRARELEEMLKAATKADEPKLGKKPTLEESDYDADLYEQKLSKWFEEKRKFDEEENKAELEKKKQADAWNSKLQGYHVAKKELKVDDFEDAESTVLDTFSQTQQGILVQGADNPALLVYALGKNPKKAKELSEEKDYIKFAFNVAKLEAQLKVTKKTNTPAPEKKVQGNASISGSSDSTLERLRAEAAKTGDLSKVMQYKRDKKK